MELMPNIKTYDWGKIGNDSEVAKLHAENSSSVNISATTPYAEWWMGDHFSGSAVVKATGEKLSDVIARDPSLIGGFDKLPYLLKVLSIGKALSIQVHPNKEEAEILHRISPDLYKDPNHKPELAIALTPFSALCGFRPYEELYAVLKEQKPLVDLIGEENIEKLKATGSTGLRECYSVLMRSSADAVNRCIASLMTKFNEKDFKSNATSEIFLRLQQDFPNDVGSLNIFFLNVIRLQPGQAIFLPAKEPHAYLDGNCIECMACSDNVIRAGLTPKFKDVEQLLKMLNYEGAPVATKLFRATRSDAFTDTFVPAVQDFAVAKIQVPSTEREYRIRNRKNGSILMVLSGTVTANVASMSTLVLRRGSVIFWPATSDSIDLYFENENESTFVAYQAMCNDFIA